MNTQGPGVEVELDDPAMLDHHSSATQVDEFGVEENVNSYEDIDGELFVDGVSVTDIDQQAIADCHFMTALASLALTNRTQSPMSVCGRGMTSTDL